MDEMVNNCTVIILAAGRSERMGSPKQLLRYHGKTLMQHAIDEAKTSNAATVMVILGHAAEQIVAETNMTGIRLVLNPDWEKGMASSIVTGINALQKERSQADTVILMVCDQPFVDSALLNALIVTQKGTGKPIVACEYGDVIGVPALYRKKYFDQLLQLKGDAGAKKIISENLDDVAVIRFALGNIDIDTPEAYQNLDKNDI